MNKLRRHPYLLALSIISFIVGLTLIVSDYTRIINLIYFIIGGGLVFTGISKFLMGNEFQDKSYFYDGVSNIIIGVLIMFVHNFVVMMILGMLFVLFPLYRIYKSADKKYAFKRELPLLIIGLVIALSGDLIAEAFVKILGGLFIVLAIYLFVNIFIEKLNINVFGYTYVNEEKMINKDIIDVEYEESESDE